LSGSVGIKVGSPGAALTSGASEVEKLARILAIGVISGNPTWRGGSIAGSSSDSKLPSAATRVGTRELIILGSDASTVLRANSPARWHPRRYLAGSWRNWVGEHSLSKGVHQM